VKQTGARIDRRLALTLMCVTLSYIGCSTSTSTSTAPTPSKCQVSVPATLQAVTSAGGPMIVAISAQPECAWTASVDANWISITPSSGQGDGQVEAVVARNDEPATREARLTINGAVVPFAQEGAPCRFTITLPAAPAAASGGPITLTVAALAGCVWTATTSESWLTPVGSTSGTGPGSVTFNAAANSGAARSGSVTIGGQIVTVNQSAPVDCAVAVSPQAASLPAAGGTAALTVSTIGSCSWTANSSASWLTAAPASGAGSKRVVLQAAPNSGAARNTSVVVGNQTVTIDQAGGTPCTFDVAPISAGIPAGGGSTSLVVTTSATCSWRANSPVTWVTVWP